MARMGQVIYGWFPARGNWEEEALLWHDQVETAFRRGRNRRPFPTKKIRATFSAEPAKEHVKLAM